MNKRAKMALYRSHDYKTSFKSIVLSVQKKFNIDFQDDSHDSNLWFPIRTILTSFDLQVTLILPMKFQVNWFFGSGEKVQNRFSRWWPWWPSWISDQNYFSHFWSASHPDTSYQVSCQLAFWFRGRSSK